MLTFSYTVVTPNISTQGIAVLENTLELNGGTIKDADSVDATLTHTGRAHNAGHKVNSGLQPATPKSPSSQRPRFASGFGAAQAGTGHRHDAGDPAGGGGGRGRSLHLCADVLAGGPRRARLRCRDAAAFGHAGDRGALDLHLRGHGRERRAPRYCPSG